jgi:hypothetical protein
MSVIVWLRVAAAILGALIVHVIRSDSGSANHIQDAVIAAVDWRDRRCERPANQDVDGLGGVGLEVSGSMTVTSGVEE